MKRTTADFYQDTRLNPLLARNTITLIKDYLKVQTLSSKCRFDIYTTKFLVNLILWIMILFLSPTKQ